MLRNVGLRKSVEQPVLDLNFAASQIGSNGAPDARMNDFNRGSNAWFVDSDGLVKKSPHNLLTNSEDVTVWTVFNTTVSANAAESPTGELTADKVIADSGQTTHIVRRDITGLDDSVDVAVSVYLKQAGFTSVAIQFYDKNSTFHSSGNFDLTDGSRISNATSGTQSSIEHVGNDWYRVTFTGIDTGTGSSNPSIRFGASGTGDGSKGFLIWGAQFSQHSTLPVGNPYVKTDSSAVYAARLDHDPTWFMSAAQEQNLLEYSEMLDDSGWTKLGGLLQVTANAEEAPDGTTTAEYIFANSPSGQFPQVHQDFDAKNGATHTLSFYAKAAERDVIKVNLSETDGTFVSNIILETGISTTEWTRFSATFTASSDAHRVVFLIGDGAQTWSGSQGLYLWGVQIEVGSTASTYHRTEGAPYYGPGATPKGLLIEEQRANLIGYSEDFSASGLNPAQSPGGSLTLTHNDALAPDGTTTATKLVATSSGGNTGHLLYKVVSVDNDTTVTASVFMKNAGQRWGYLQLANTGYVSDKNAYADLENGVLGAASDSSATIEDYGNGWYRVSLTNTTDSDGGNDVVAIGVAEDDGDTIFTGDDTNGIYIWGWQKELGSFPTSYIKNTGTGATRNADVATMGPTTGGTELVTNGTFDTDTSNWTVVRGATLSVSSGQLTVAGDAQYGSGAIQDFSTVAGRRYRASFDIISVSASAAARVTITNNSNDVGGIIADATSLNAGNGQTLDFTAEQATSYIVVRAQDPSTTVVYDNVSVRELYPFEQYNPAEGTLYSLSSCTGDDTHTVLSVHADSFDNYFSHTYRFGNSLRNFSKGGGSTELQTAEAVTLSNRNEIATTYDGTSMDMSANGSDETTGTLGADIVGIHEIAFGLRYTANQYSGHIERVQYFPRALPKVTLQSLTSD